MKVPRYLIESLNESTTAIEDAMIGLLDVQTCTITAKIAPDLGSEHDGWKVTMTYSGYNNWELDIDEIPKPVHDPGECQTEKKDARPGRTRRRTTTGKTPSDDADFAGD